MTKLSLNVDLDVILNTNLVDDDFVVTVCLAIRLLVSFFFMIRDQSDSSLFNSIIVDFTVSKNSQGDIYTITKFPSFKYYAVMMRHCFLSLFDDRTIRFFYVKTTFENLIFRRDSHYPRTTNHWLLLLLLLL